MKQLEETGLAYDPGFVKLMINTDEALGEESKNRYRKRNKHLTALSRLYGREAPFLFLMNKGIRELINA